MITDQSILKIESQKAILDASQQTEQTLLELYSLLGVFPLKKAIKNKEIIKN